MLGIIEWILTPYGFAVSVLICIVLLWLIKKYLSALNASSEISASKDAELSSLHKDLDTRIRDVKDQKATITQKEVRIQELTHVLDTVYKQLNTCKAEVASRDLRLLELHNLIAVQEDTLKNSADELVQLHESLNWANDTVQQQRQELNEQKVKYIQICDALSHSNQTLVSKNKDLEERLRIAENTLRSYASSANALRNSIEDLDNKNTEKADMIARLKRDIESLEQRLSEKTIERSDPQARLDYLLDLQRPENEHLRRGLAYELQIGKWYEEKGFFVLYAGIVLGMEDHGIDLVAIPPSGDRTLIVQCKNYHSPYPLEHRHINSFLNSVSIYSRHQLINDKPILIHTSSLHFGNGVKEELESLDIYHYQIDFDPAYLDGLYGKLDQIRSTQYALFFDSKGNNILMVSIQHKANELRAAHLPAD